MIALTISVPAIFVIVLVYILLNPDKAERIAGWFWRGIAAVLKKADRRAVALSVQGDINTARADLIKNGPDGVVGGKLKLNFANAEEAEAIIRDGEVVVFMDRSRHREANLANAVMAYLPKAVLPRARTYVDKETMRASDLILARSILSHNLMPSGALNAFFDRHMDPAINAPDGEKLRLRVEQVDSIDLHGWLTRVMLNEYRYLGDRLHPGHGEDRCLKEAASFCSWLAGLAVREPGSTTNSLKYQGQYLNAGIIFVAQRELLERRGTSPYRRRAKQLIYTERCDVVYLMARDANISAVKKVRDELASDGLIADRQTWEYGLRSDFAARQGLKRERAIIVALRRRRADSSHDADAGEDLETDETIEVFDASAEAQAPGDSQTAASASEPSPPQ